MNAKTQAASLPGGKYLIVKVDTGNLGLDIVRCKSPKEVEAAIDRMRDALSTKHADNIGVITFGNRVKFVGENSDATFAVAYLFNLSNTSFNGETVENNAVVVAPRVKKTKKGAEETV